MNVRTLAAIAAAFLLATTAAGAKSLAPTASAAASPAATTTTDPFQAIQSFTVGDLQNALADAQANNDTVAAACYSVLIPFVQANVKNPLPDKLGAFLALQKARDLKSVVSAGIPAAINVACAPLVLDATSTILGLGAKVGLVAVSPLHLPIPLPGL